MLKCLHLHTFYNRTQHRPKEVSIWQFWWGLMASQPHPCQTPTSWDLFKFIQENLLKELPLLQNHQQDVTRVAKENLPFNDFLFLNEKFDCLQFYTDFVKYFIRCQTTIGFDKSVMIGFGKHKNYSTFVCLIHLKHDRLREKQLFVETLLCPGRTPSFLN